MPNSDPAVFVVLPGDWVNYHVVDDETYDAEICPGLVRHDGQTVAARLALTGVVEPASTRKGYVGTALYLDTAGRVQLVGRRLLRCMLAPAPQAV